MMTIDPLRWYNWDFTVTKDERTLARLDLSTWRERGAITIRDVEHRVYRESLNGDFVIERAGQVLARATKPSAFRSAFTVTYNGQAYTLHRRSAWRRAFVLLDGDREIGSMSPDGPWMRVSTADLPRDWPMPIKAFVIWLVIVLWKREAQS